MINVNFEYGKMIIDICDLIDSEIPSKCPRCSSIMLETERRKFFECNNKLCKSLIRQSDALLVKKLYEEFIVYKNLNFPTMHLTKIQSKKYSRSIEMYEFFLKINNLIEYNKCIYCDKNLLKIIENSDDYNCQSCKITITKNSISKCTEIEDQLTNSIKNIGNFMRTAIEYENPSKVF